MESPDVRSRAKKVDTKKLSALEKLKKARQGEKVEDEPEPEEEDIWEYEEIDEDEEEEFESKSSKSKSSKNNRHESRESESKKPVKRNYTKDKSSSGSTASSAAATSESNDIRTAFMRSSMVSSSKPSKSNAEASVKIDEDELANEIMQELSKKKAQRAATSQKPAVMASQSNIRAPSKPMSMNSPAASNAMCLSPAHKRKPSPSSGLGAGGASIPPKSKKLDLDVEMIPIEIKKENIDPDEQEALENIELLSLLDSSLKQEPINHEVTTIAANTTTPFIDDFQMQVKSEPETLMDLNRTAMDESKVLDADLQLQLENQAQSNKFLFYWYDLFEDQFNPNSTVYMFGKMPVKIKRDESDAASTTATTPDQQLTFVSVCCVVKNLPKRVYILPRRNKRPRGAKAEPGEEKKPEPVTMDMVAQEVAEIMAKMKINNYSTKVVRKHFAFDKKLADNYDYESVPVESEYLQLEYHSDSSAKVLSADLVGETFACVFGAQTSYTEHLVIDLKLKGPNWLEITNGKRRENQLSWCKCEYEVSNYRDISVYKDNVTLDSPAIPLPPTPPLTLLTLLLRTVLNPKTQEHEIVCAAGLVMNKFYLEKATTPSTIQKQPLLYDSYFCALSKPSQAIFPYDLSNTLKNYQSKLRVNECGPERALISFLLSKIQSLDVDVLVGHDLFGFSLDILLNRCNVHKIPHWSRLGRLKRSQMPHLPHHRAGGAPRSTAVNNLAIQQRIQTVFSGRLLCDVMLSAKELLTKCKSFDLPELVNHLLVKKDPIVANAIASRDYEEERNVANYYASSQQLLKLLRLTMDDCMYISRIVNDLQCLQLAYQITCIAGNVLSRTLVGGRSERNEYLLLHAFFDKDFILPEKLTAFKAKQAAAAAAASKSKKVVTIKSEETTMNETASNQTAAALEENEDEMLSRMIIDEESSQPRVKREDGAPVNTHSGSSNGYTGGLVLEPKIGFYDKFILLLDFNSLYPSIIQEYNICFTTVFRPKNQLAENDIDEYIETCIRAPPSDEKPGILPLEIRKLVDSRRQVKQLAAQTTNPELKMQYDIRQKALKLTANSVYGCLGFENSRFYCKPLAALITRNGRNILMKTKELVESKKIEVIYGDTDSIMINTNLTDFDQVYKLGNMIKSEVNKLYRNLEIDIDGVYKCLLLLRKKKYAALTISRNPKDNSLVTQKEIKGLDIVRRDWCPLARQIGERVLDEILSGQSYDVVLTNINKILNDTGDKVRNNMFDLALFEISKQLNRNPEDYNDANHQPHVLVALRHNSDNANSKKYKSGDVVSYIICEDGTQNSATQRAYSKSELLKASAEAAKNTTNTSALKLDTKYYLAQQVHPVVTRLCESFEGIDGYHIAQCLGLDPTGFRHKSTAASSHSTVSIAPTQLTKQQQRIESYLNELEKFNNCVAFKYVCPNCKTEQSWQSLFVKVAPTTSTSGSVKPEPKQEEDEDDDILNLDGTNIVKTAPKTAQSISSNNFRCILDSCANPVCKLKPISKLAYVKNSLALQMHKFIKQYYQGWLVCEEPLCRYRTKRISCKLVDGKHRCIECEKSPVYLEYSHSDLYYQLKFFKFIFDIDSYKNFYKDDAAEVSHILKNNQQLQQALNQLKDQAAKKIRMDAFGIVDMKSLFKFAAGNGMCFKSE